jgi:hypothetical protein
MSVKSNILPLPPSLPCYKNNAKGDQAPLAPVICRIWIGLGDDLKKIRDSAGSEKSLKELRMPVIQYLLPM